METWAASQGCDERVGPYATETDGVPGLRCVERPGCETGAEIVDCAWDGGHDWPRTEAGDASADLIWDFFERNGRGQAPR